MKVYLVVGCYSNGCSWSSEEVIATYSKLEDAQLHALYANEKNQSLLDAGIFNDSMNPYDPDSCANVNTSYDVDVKEVLETFTIKESNAQS